MVCRRIPGRRQPSMACVICMRQIDTDPSNDNIASLVWCSHTFHARCIRIWINTTGTDSATCPTCRAPVRAKDEWIKIIVQENTKRRTYISKDGMAWHYLYPSMKLVQKTTASLARIEDLYASIHNHLGDGTYVLCLCSPPLADGAPDQMACAVPVRSTCRPRVLDALRICMLFPHTTDRTRGSVLNGLESRTRAHHIAILDFMRNKRYNAIDWLQIHMR